MNIDADDSVPLTGQTARRHRANITEAKHADSHAAGQAKNLVRKTQGWPGLGCASSFRYGPRNTCRKAGETSPSDEPCPWRAPGCSLALARGSPSSTLCQFSSASSVTVTSARRMEYLRSEICLTHTPGANCQRTTKGSP